MIYVLYNIVIIHFLLLLLYWENCQYSFITYYLDKIKYIVWYCGFGHTWNIFTNPYHYNRTIFLNIIFEDDSIESTVLYNPDDNLFFNKSCNGYDVKYIDYIGVDAENNQARRLISDYIVHYYQLQNKKVKTIEFIIESETIQPPGIKNYETTVESVFVYEAAEYV